MISARRAVAALGTALIAGGALAASLSGCDTARILAPPPPLRVASASPYAVDVEFAEPLDRTSAGQVSHYTLIPVGGGAPAVIASATLVDTLYGRVVQLLIPDWLGTGTDTTDWTVGAANLRAADGRSLEARNATFRTGLSYRATVRALLDARCTSCHGPSQPAGNYRTDSYAALFGNGSNSTPNLIASDPTCLLVRKCKPRNSMFDLARLTYLDYEILINWVTSYGARE
jgi:hypothetical protein